MALYRFVLFALAAASVAGSAFAWTPGAEAEKALRSGQAWAEVEADQGGVAVIRSVVDIPAPPRVVWTVATDCRMAFRMIGGLTVCRVLQGDQRQGWDVREQVTKASVFLPDIHNVMRSDYQPFNAVRFHKAGGDLEVEDGEWLFLPIQGGAGTRVIYVNRVKTNIMAPAGIVRQSLRAGTPKMLMSLRKECIAAAAGSRLG